MPDKETKLPYVTVDEAYAVLTSGITEEKLAELEASAVSVEANPTIPEGTTASSISAIRIGESYYTVASSGSGQSVSVEVDEETETVVLTIG